MNKYLKEKNARLESVPDDFENDVEQDQISIFNGLLGLLDKLKRDDNGNIIYSSNDLQNLLIITTIITGVRKILLQEDYLNSVDTYIQEFDLQAALNNKYFASEFPEFSNSKAADETLAVAKKGAIDLLLGEPLESNFIMPIKSVLEDAVTSGASWSETVKNIRDFVEGNPETDGRLLQYAKQIAKDEFSIADRSYSNAVAEELDIEFFVYSGQELPTSRCFCKERHDKYFHYKEIESWGAGDNLGECDTGDGTWAGERDGTNEQTIFQYAGGYNCGHSIMGVSVFSVPKDDLQKAIDAGYYQPSEKEAELLGI